MVFWLVSAGEDRVLKILVAAVVVVLAFLVALAVRSAQLRRRRFDERSDVTKLVLSAGKRRQDSKTNARFLRGR